MSVTIQTIVSCDDCGETNSADDAAFSAKEIRRVRRQWGWVQRGSKDFCGECAKKPENRKEKA